MINRKNVDLMFEKQVKYILLIIV